MKKTRKKWIAAVLLAGMNPVLMQIFLHNSSYCFPWYRTFSKVWIGFLSFLSGWSAFALWDWILLVVILYLALTLVLSVKRRKCGVWLCNTALLASVIYTEVNCGWMLNHYAPDLKLEIGLEVSVYSSEQLAEACEYYLTQAMLHTDGMERDEQGHVKDTHFEEYAKEAGRSYVPLQQKWPIFEGSQVRVKKLSVIGEYLMYNGIIGMFMPVTGEAGVPEHVPVVSQPYTMAHEAAHRLGLADEEEANFAAFLACMHSEQEAFVYSGYYSAFNYCFNALYRADAERAKELVQAHAEEEGIGLLFLDRADAASVYKRYESKLQDVSDQINDTYLKAYSESDGVKSYGKVTDELIAWYDNKSGF